MYNRKFNLSEFSFSWKKLSFIIGKKTFFLLHSIQSPKFLWDFCLFSLHNYCKNIADFIFFLISFNLLLKCNTNFMKVAAWLRIFIIFFFFYLYFINLALLRFYLYLIYLYTLIILLRWFYYIYLTSYDKVNLLS